MTDDRLARETATGYLQLLDRSLRTLDVDAVLRVCRHLQRARDAGRTVYVAGNGGSAATAAHWANDLGKATKSAGLRPMRVVCLNEHVSWLTALANDEGYERVFAGQLENFIVPGDVLVVFSASGSSANLVEAVLTAGSLGAVTVGFVGFDGGVLKPMVNECVWIETPKGAYGPVEDAHLVTCHLITTCLATPGAIAVDTAPIAVVEGVTSVAAQ
jgi:D-sedoheptulose 7-phosphate isomerase